MRDDEQRALEAIAADLEVHDPALARRLSTRRRPTRELLDLRLRQLTLVAIWLLGFAFGATLLLLGLVRHVELTTAAGAATDAVVAALGLVLLHRSRVRGG